MTPFIELNNAYDEWPGRASGLFIGQFCLAGVDFWRSKNRAHWTFSIIIVNISFGLSR